MTFTEGSDQILKTDSLARLRTPPERKQELLEEFERSGLSGIIESRINNGYGFNHAKPVHV
jgi:hypothetical protein